jgi:hypothetical protein
MRSVRLDPAKMGSLETNLDSTQQKRAYINHFWAI